MVQLCFVIDLRTLPPPLLVDLKQSLLQLANFYAISSSSSSARKSDTLSDKIGLCYVVKNRLTSSDELMIAYRPVGNFNLRDFHHAVNNLPSDAFLPDIDSISDVMISDVLSERVLYSWQGKDIERRVIVITSILPEDVNSVMQKSLSDAADKCVSVDFAVFQQKSSHLTDSRENINNFRRCISHLDNCSVQTYITDFRSFNGLVKRWLQVLKDDMDKPLQARLVFKDDLLDSVNHIFCNLLPPVNPIANGFSQCQTCRCHGIPLGDAEKKLNMFSCPVTGSNLETCDVNENSVRVGEKTILFLPSFHNSLKLLPIYSPINLIVTERINLASLDEGLIMGASFVMTPSPYYAIETNSDDTDQSDMNAKLFQGLSSVLHSMDQGLICSSNCDLETMTEAPYLCYYILQPSDNGSMLMRRLAGAEEVKQAPDNRLIESTVNKDVENSVQACLLKVDLAEGNQCRESNFGLDREMLDTQVVTITEECGLI
ncbi:NDX1 homeobox protein [Trifolium pratense]|uniref:NDX1 homeobox protein n=1 Tax=Trifolium pratense TaxID=57577 RepID=A0A2K3NUK6_TRIPR|nr:NDX1 homeobox protein [Trifolium pratense]